MAELSAAILRRMFETIREGVGYYEAVRDSDGAIVDLRVLWHNQAGAALSGVPLEAHLGKTWCEMWPGDHRSIFAHYSRADATGGPVQFGVDYPHTGRIYDVVIYKLAPDEFLATFYDVTDLKRHAAALQNAHATLLASEEHNRLCTEVANVATWEMDLRSNSMSRSGNHDALYGLAPQPAWRLETFIEALHPEDRAASLEQITAATLPDGPDRYRFEFRVIWPDASVHWLEMVGHVVLRDALGAGQLLRGSLIDITERRRAEEGLRESEARFRLMAENATDMISRHAPDGTVLYASPSCLRLTGYLPEELVGRQAFDFVEPADHATVRTFFTSIVEGEDVRSTQFRIRHKAGLPLWLEISARTIRDPRTGAVREIQASTRDISERKAVEEQLRTEERVVALALTAAEDANEALRSTQAQLLQAQKMEAIGRLAGGVAHDFNNLLSVILCYASITAKAPGVTGAVLEGLDEIRKAGERAAELTRQLLAFGRQQIIVPRVLDLNEVVRAFENMVCRTIGADIDVSLRLSERLGACRADRGQIEQVLLNLAVNARDAMPYGGMLTIETLNIDLDASYAATHADVVPGRYVMLAVSDSGVGMDDATRGRIFEPFFTTKEQGKGTGLGLSTVFGIVKQSGGHVSVHSELGRGSTFKIYLPTVDAPVDVDVRQSPVPTRDAGTETVLIVDDDAPVRTVMRAALERRGYRVLEASNASEALEIIGTHVAPIHLLISDIVMPKVSGRQLADKVVALRPTVKVLYVSGYTRNTVAHNGVLDEGIAFLSKPITPEALARKVRDVLDAPSR